MTRKRNSTWRAVRQAIGKTNDKGICSSKTRCQMICGDARLLLDVIPNESIDCIITSPPYGALKNYGSRNQLGFGQNQKKEYFPDLSRVITQLYRVAKPGTALWVVSDTLRVNSQTVPLPWEIIDRARNVGWILQDLIIWDKGRSLPWSHKGRFRGVCEYIALLAKERLGNFNINAVRETDYLSSYWVRYPERFHPEGKAPSDLWHFPIPIQGSWSKTAMRHFCPFPVGLVARMISLSTRKGEVVLDPFAGTGSVIAVASHMGRQGLGVEVNSGFVRTFDRSGYQMLARRARVEVPNGKKVKQSLYRTIVQLRMQKFPKTLFSQLSRSDRLNGDARSSIANFVLANAEHVAVDKQDRQDKFILAKIKLLVLAKAGADIVELKSEIKRLVKAPPLSKFGVRAEICVIRYRDWSTTLFSRVLADKNRWYVYRKGTFFKYEKILYKKSVHAALLVESNLPTKIPTIFSSLKLDVVAPIEE